MGNMKIYLKDQSFSKMLFLTQVSKLLKELQTIHSFIINSLK